MNLANGDTLKNVKSLLYKNKSNRSTIIAQNKNLKLVKNPEKATEISSKKDVTITTYKPHFIQLLIREYDKSSLKITDQKIAVDACTDLFSMPKETVVALFLDAKLQLILREIITIGTVSSSLIHPREVFRSAIIQNASSLILLHNHPSGICDPSTNDITALKKIRNVGKIIGIPLLDFIIFAPDGSFNSIL